MDKTFFSLIVPIYNVSAYLNDCLSSLVSVKYDKFEIILVNDGSTDGSEAICLDYCKRFPFVKYYYKENGGLSSARNFGIEKACGEYLLFIDSDDFLTDDDFLNEMNGLIGEKRADLIMTLPTEYASDGKTIVKTHEPKGSYVGKTVNAGNVIDELYFSDNPYITMAQTKIVRRDFVLKNDLFFTEGIYHEDDDWIARVLLCYPETTVSDVAAYGYRHRDNSIVHTADTRVILKKACDRVSVAERILKLESAEKHRNFLTYFIGYYVNAFGEAAKESGIAEKFLDYADEHAVMPTMKFSLNRKHRFIFLYSKIFGVKAANRLIFRRVRANGKKMAIIAG